MGFKAAKKRFILRGLFFELNSNIKRNYRLYGTKAFLNNS